MRKIFSAFVVLCVLAWLLPLGAFIKPFQEKSSCGGKRAFHMCSMMQSEADPSSSTTPAFQSASGFDHQAKSQASGGGNDLTMSRDAAHLAADPFLKLNEPPLFLYCQRFVNLLDPPPKARPLF
ncbi:MAG: hypothetical protein ACREH5_02360 [Candidatus Omnitrophota bacterium]